MSPTSTPRACAPAWESATGTGPPALPPSVGQAPARSTTCSRTVSISLKYAMAGRPWARSTVKISDTATPSTGASTPSTSATDGVASARTSASGALSDSKVRVTSVCSSVAVLRTARVARSSVTVTSRLSEATRLVTSTATTATTTSRRHCVPDRRRAVRNRHGRRAAPWRAATPASVIVTSDESERHAPDRDPDESCPTSGRAPTVASQACSNRYKHHSGCTARSGQLGVDTSLNAVLARSGRLAHDQLGLEDLRLGGLELPGQPREEQLTGSPAHLDHRVAHGGQGRRGRRRHAEVVEADHPHVARDGTPGSGQYPEGAGCHQVRRGEDAVDVRVGRKQPLRRRGAAGGGEVPADHRLVGEPCLVQGGAPAGETVDPCCHVKGAGDGGDPGAPSGDQVLGCDPPAGGVVQVDVRHVLGHGPRPPDEHAGQVGVHQDLVEGVVTVVGDDNGAVDVPVEQVVRRALRSFTAPGDQQDQLDVRRLERRADALQRAGEVGVCEHALVRLGYHKSDGVGAPGDQAASRAVRWVAEQGDRLVDRGLGGRAHLQAAVDGPRGGRSRDTCLFGDLLQGRRVRDVKGWSPHGAGQPVSYTHLRAHETRHDLVCRLLLEKKKKNKEKNNKKAKAHKPKKQRTK